MGIEMTPRPVRNPTATATPSIPTSATRIRSGIVGQSPRSVVTFNRAMAGV